MSYFSIAAFKTFSVFAFQQFDYVLSRCYCLWGYPTWSSLSFLDVWINVLVLFYQIWDISPISSSHILSTSLALFSPGIPIMHWLSCFISFCRSCMLLFFGLFVCCTDWMISVITSFRKLIRSSALFNLLFIVLSLVFVSAIKLSNFDWFLYSSSSLWFAFISLSSVQFS